MSCARKRVVFDTSALVGAVLLPRSIPAIALEIASISAELLASAETLAELSDVLRRPHLDRYRSLQERLDFLALYRDLATLVQVSAAVTACRDPKDDKFLSLAVSAGASIIVASDEDLRVLDPYQSIRVLAPKQFVEDAFALLDAE
jgi:uncharacterized protein